MDVWESKYIAERIAALDTSQPQYLEALFWAPHPPLAVPEPWFSMYPPEEIDLPETVGRWYDGQAPSLLQQLCGVLGVTRTREEYRGVWSAHFGLVTMVDECIGRVVQALNDKGIWEESLVIFTGDHGDMLGEHYLYQKMCCYEAAAHLPLLIKPPGGGTGRRHELVSGVDYCPTICDYADVSAPEGINGRSIRPLVEGRQPQWPDAVIMEYNGEQGRNNLPSRTIVADVEGATWKYIHSPDNWDELYNVTADPWEKESLVHSEAHQALRRQLRNRLAAWMQETGDSLVMPPLEIESQTESA